MSFIFSSIAKYGIKNTHPNPFFFQLALYPYFNPSNIIKYNLTLNSIKNLIFIIAKPDFSLENG
jgi:hypothetical protein